MIIKLHRILRNILLILIMKNSKTYNESEDFEIPLFNFENSLPNKYAKQYDEDDISIILKSNSVKTVVLDSDIADYFPDSKSVNFALRSIIKAIPAISQKAIL
jgi:hypothetical protein